MRLARIVHQIAVPLQKPYLSSESELNTCNHAAAHAAVPLWTFYPTLCQSIKYKQRQSSTA